MLVPSSAPAQEPGLDAGPLLSSCPSTLLEQVPRSCHGHTGWGNTKQEAGSS